MAWMASTPSITGILKSMSTIDGWCARYCSSACSPSAASATTRMSGSRAITAARPSRINGWSSTVRMVMPEGAAMQKSTAPPGRAHMPIGLARRD
ncbi:hypothetical protein D3C83_78090 [compost metagenome]